MYRATAALTVLHLFLQMAVRLLTAAQARSPDLLQVLIRILLPILTDVLLPLLLLFPSLRHCQLPARQYLMYRATAALTALHLFLQAAVRLLIAEQAPSQDLLQALTRILLPILTDVRLPLLLLSLSLRLCQL